LEIQTKRTGSEGEKKNTSLHQSDPKGDVDAVYFWQAEKWGKRRRSRRPGEKKGETKTVSRGRKRASAGKSW